MNDNSAGKAFAAAMFIIMSCSSCGPMREAESSSILVDEKPSLDNLTDLFYQECFTESGIRRAQVLFRDRVRTCAGNYDQDCILRLGDGATWSDKLNGGEVVVFQLFSKKVYNYVFTHDEYQGFSGCVMSVSDKLGQNLLAIPSKLTSRHHVEFLGHTDSTPDSTFDIDSEWLTKANVKIVVSHYKNASPQYPWGIALAGEH